ncbi:MAG: hypothetical protein V1492_00695 [Candidatus Micrarchaeota archaeon]
MEHELLVDYLEHASEYLRKKRQKLRKLKAEYDQLYEKDIREEMDATRSEMELKQREVIDKLYENAEELKYLKKYFPEFFQVLLEDEQVGPMLRKKDMLYVTVKIAGAQQQLASISAARHQLKDAIKFLEKWPGVIREKQLVATYPILKDHVKGDLESSDAIERIRHMEKKLKKEGWRGVISNPELLAPVVQRFANRLKKAELEVLQAKMKQNEAKGRGTNMEYLAIKMLRNAEARKARLERIIRHLLLSNPEFLTSLKTKKNWLEKGRKTDLDKIAEKITARKVKEKVWLGKMSKKLKA